MMLDKLGLRADEVATLTLDNIDWRSRRDFVRAKGRRRRRCQCLQTSAQLSSPTCVMAARRRRVAGCFCACWHPKSALTTSGIKVAGAGANPVGQRRD